MKYPRLIVSALSGGSGKTITSLGIIAALRAKENCISPYKKGPDYIDAGWLALAAGQPCYNLDTFLLSPDKIVELFITHTQTESIAIIEANRGIYDSIDTHGSTSTAELAKLLKTPVVLCLDCTKTTRTLAALVHGCMIFDPQVQFAGIVLNRVAGARHENIIRQCIESHTGLKVIGAIPRLKENIFPERHMGLVPMQEHQWTDDAIISARKVAERYLDINKVYSIAHKANSLLPKSETETIAIHHINSHNTQKKVKIGIARDAAFQFYYSENLDALEKEGADLIYVSPMTDHSLPDIDALYLGGGFPETQVNQLESNQSFRYALRQAIQYGLPVYAECGGLMYLGQTVIVDNKPFEMASIFSIKFDLSKRPVAHGYSVIKVCLPNPVFPVGTELRGHEFHYSRVMEWNKQTDETLAFQMIRGKGFWDQHDGLCFNQVLAAYTHVHALGTPQWAPGLVSAAKLFQTKKKDHE